MRPEALLVRTPAGLWCRAGGFYIDPRRPVDRALVTHAHSDHYTFGVWRSGPEGDELVPVGKRPIASKPWKECLT